MPFTTLFRIMGQSVSVSGIQAPGGVRQACTVVAAII